MVIPAHLPQRLMILYGSTALMKTLPLSIIIDICDAHILQINPLPLLNSDLLFRA